MLSNRYRTAFFWIALALMLAGIGMIGYLYIRYCILTSIAPAIFLVAFWEPLLICLAWTGLCGATLIWIDEPSGGTKR